MEMKEKYYCKRCKNCPDTIMEKYTRHAYYYWRGDTKIYEGTHTSEGDEDGTYFCCKCGTELESKLVEV